jgi:hypothetical protein
MRLDLAVAAPRSPVAIAKPENTPGVSNRWTATRVAPKFALDHVLEPEIVKDAIDRRRAESGLPIDDIAAAGGIVFFIGGDGAQNGENILVVGSDSKGGSIGLHSSPPSGWSGSDHVAHRWSEQRCQVRFEVASSAADNGQPGAGDGLPSRSGDANRRKWAPDTYDVYQCKRDVRATTVLPQSECWIDCWCPQNLSGSAADHGLSMTVEGTSTAL